jgi:hypothetical protein
MGKRAFSKEEVQMAIKEMQIKTLLRFHLTPVRMVSSRTQTTNVGEDKVEKEPSYTVGGSVNWYNHYRKQYGAPQKTKNKTAI